MIDETLRPDELNFVLARLREIEWVRELSESDLRRLAGLARPTPLVEGQLLVRQGETPRDLILIAEGELEVIKEPEREPGQGPPGPDEPVEGPRIAALGSGQVAGEMAMIDLHPRAATLRATEASLVFLISLERLLLDRDYGKVKGHLVASVARSLSGRLRATGALTAESMRAELELARDQLRIGRFLIHIVATISLYTLGLSALQSATGLFSSTTTVSLALIVLFAGVMVVMVRQNGMKLRDHGVTLGDWRRDLPFAILVTLPVLGTILLAKWLVVTFAADLPDRSLFSPYSSFTGNASPGAGVVVASILGYAAFCPIQEFIARGGLQGSLMAFFGRGGRGGVWTSILLSNLLFAATHSHTSLGFALTAFIPGIFWGWLYARQGSLLGVSVSHVMVGCWGAFVVGFQHII